MSTSAESDSVLDVVKMESFRDYHLTCCGVKSRELYDFIVSTEKQQGYTRRGCLQCSFKLDYPDTLDILYVPFDLFRSFGVNQITSYVEKVPDDKFAVYFSSKEESTVSAFMASFTTKRIDADHKLKPGPPKIVLRLGEFRDHQYVPHDTLTYYQSSTVEYFMFHIALCQAHFDEFLQMSSHYVCKFDNLEETKGRQHVTFFAATGSRSSQRLIVQFHIEGTSFDVEIDNSPPVPSGNDTLSLGPAETLISLWSRAPDLARTKIVHRNPSIVGKCLQCDSDLKVIKRCGSCKKAYYCSIECQRKHWATAHRFACKKY